jgi:hypothetical protein
MLGLFEKKAEPKPLPKQAEGIPCKKSGIGLGHPTLEAAEKCCGTGKAHDAPDPKIEEARQKEFEAQMKRRTIANLEAGVKNAKACRSFIEITEYQGRDAAKVAEVLSWLDGIGRLFEAELMDVKAGRKNFGELPKK